MGEGSFSRIKSGSRDVASQAFSHSPKEWILRSQSLKRRHPGCLFSLGLHAFPHPCSCCAPAQCSEMRLPAEAPQAPSDQTVGGAGRSEGKRRKRWGFLSSPSLLLCLLGPVLTGCQSHCVPICPFSPGESNSFPLLSLWAPRCPLFVPCPYSCILSLRVFSFKPGVSKLWPTSQMPPPPSPFW